jgi:deoxycytidylate deaminase
MIDQLVELAKQSPHPKQRMAAIVTDKRSIPLAKATNSPTKTHPEQAKFAKRAGKPKQVFLHAEISALVKNKNVAGNTLYVLRLGKDNSIRLARPCPVCWEAIIQDGNIETVYYSDNNGLLVREDVEEYKNENRE